mmetsp:Transcript_45149/g.96404  ORF Transcript_45149/g.96404 Transcript_45149/m.96404 type:complete len:165 (+) Transcript_45149:542-1036(+)
MAGCRHAQPHSLLRCFALLRWRAAARHRLLQDRGEVEDAVQRFGFIADDVAQTMPQVIRETPARYKGIAYQDLIAVLTAVLQSVTQRVEIADSGAQEQRLRLESLEASLSRLEATLDRHAAIMEARLRSIEAAIRRRRGVKGSLRRRRGSGRAATALGASRGDS